MSEYPCVSPVRSAAGVTKRILRGGDRAGRGEAGSRDKPSELREIRRRLLISHDGPAIITLMLLSFFDKFLQLYCVTLNAIKLQSFV